MGLDLSDYSEIWDEGYPIKTTSWRALSVSAGQTTNWQSM